MTQYARNTAAARRRTEARIEEARILRAENRRAYGPSTGGPALTRERQTAAFPGFPPLRPAYADGQPLATRVGTHAWRLLAATRDLAARAGRWAA